ncbi:uncharacterized protein LOC143876948 [Tasmannia lanceolata]|uniref:uncharacterized protein LOC143876948 n=1 Tax=Tasmannia lanceolata TaxID=3420 RepID=UPI0040646F54
MVESGTVIHGTEVKKLITVDSEVNMVFNVSDWWVDTGATIHVCCDISAFVTYHQVDESEMLFMGNSSTAKVMGKGKVDLKLTSGKIVTLHQVLYVPEVRKNLISGYLLNKHGYKLVFESDKFILTKGGMFVGKGYACGSLFKLNVSMNEINKISDFSAYIVESYDMWHGYAQNNAAYRFLVVKSDHNSIDVNSILESRGAEFFEEMFPLKQTSVSQTVIPPTEVASSSRPQTENQESKGRKRGREEGNLEVEPRRSQRAKKATDFGSDFYTFLVEDDPSTFKEAMSSLDANFWKEAINSEIESIMSNNTWELTDLPPGWKPIDCKWILKKKLRTDGSIEKFKARLVAKGFKQKEGMDFFDTYSPVTRITTIRMLIAISTIYNLEIHQMDVKTAFLNGELEEEIYMEQPEGFVVPGQEQKVCKLIKIPL